LPATTPLSEVNCESPTIFIVEWVAREPGSERSPDTGKIGLNAGNSIRIAAKRHKFRLTNYFPLLIIKV